MLTQKILGVLRLLPCANISYLHTDTLWFSSHSQHPFTLLCFALVVLKIVCRLQMLRLKRSQLTSKRHSIPQTAPTVLICVGMGWDGKACQRLVWSVRSAFQKVPTDRFVHVRKWVIPWKFFLPPRVWNWILVLAYPVATVDSLYSLWLKPPPSSSRLKPFL